LSKIHIGFTDENIFNDKSTHPKLIRNNKPNWFINIKKNLYTETPFGKQKIKNVKSCHSFVDMFNNGVVVYAPTDIKLFVDQEKGLRHFELPYNSNTYFITDHANEQFINHLPKNSRYKYIFKIVLPLAIFTDKGFSSYQYQYPYSLNNDFEVLFGQFETDKIHETNLQIAYTSNKKEIIIKKGTPLAVYVPFRRSKLQLKIFNLNKNKKYKNIYNRQNFKLNSKFDNYYKDLF